MFAKAKERYNEALVDQFAKWLRTDEPGAYRVVEIANGAQVESFLNYSFEHGWRLHTVRDGLRNGALGDLGYRVMLERFA